MEKPSWHFSMWLAASVALGGQNLANSLLQGAWSGQEFAVENAIASGRVDVNVTDPDGLTALMLASLAGHENVIDLLLESGADPALEGEHQETALILASKYGFTEVAARLIEAGVDVNHPDASSRTAWTWAMWGDNQPLMAMLAKSGADRTAERDPFDGGGAPVDRFEKNPRMTRFKAPKLPKSLKQQGVDGTMSLDVVVDRKGKLLSVELAEGLHEALDAEALDQAKKWKFEPGRIQGKPVVSKLQVTIRFTRHADPQVGTSTRRWRR